MAKASSYASLAAASVAAGDKFFITDVDVPANKNVVASDIIQAGLLVSTGFAKLASSVLSFGPNGSTNPTFQVNGATASAATGVKVTGAAAAGGVAVAAISSGTNESMTIDAKGSGTITLNGTATGKVTTPRGLLSSGTAGIGYETGAGAAVTQATSRTTAVTCNGASGAITLVSAAGSTTPASFTVNNSSVAATDVVVLSQKSGTDKYDLSVSAVGAGSFEITFNTKSGTTTEQPVINFAVIKAVAA